MGNAYLIGTGGQGVASWNDLENRPFYEPGVSEQILWDGVLGEKETFRYNGVDYAKVSDKALSRYDFINSIISYIGANSAAQNTAITDDTNINILFGAIECAGVISVYSSSNEMSASVGTYFKYDSTYINRKQHYVSYIIRPNGFIVALDNKFISEDIARTSDISSAVDGVKADVTNLGNALNAFESHLGFVATGLEEKTVAESIAETYATKEELSELDNRIGFNNPDTDTTLCQLIEDTFATKEEISALATQEALVALDNRIGFNNPDPDTSLCQIIEETFATKDDVATLVSEEIQGQLEAIDALPVVTADDNGKVLAVVNGEWAAKVVQGGGGEGGSFMVDDTLSVPGAAADAKAVGDLIAARLGGLSFSVNENGIVSVTIDD
jgi:hypothetical protein